MPAMGLGRAAGVLAGQDLGAKQPERAERSGWLAVSFAEGILAIGVVGILLWAESIVHIFNPEPDLVKIAGLFLRIETIAYLMVAFNATLRQCLSSTGDTMAPMLFGLLMMWVLQVPLAFFLSRYTNLGVYGVRWAIVIGMVVGAIACSVYFRLGRWKRKRV